MDVLFFFSLFRSGSPKTLITRDEMGGRAQRRNRFLCLRSGAGAVLKMVRPPVIVEAGVWDGKPKRRRPGGFWEVKFCGARKFFFFFAPAGREREEKKKKDPKPGNRAKGLGRPSYQASCPDGGDAARCLGGVVARMAMSSSQDSRHVCDRVGIGRWLLFSF